MEQKAIFDRVAPHLYKRQYQTASGEWSTIFYARFVCRLKGKRRLFALGADLRTAKEEMKVLEARNVRREDFDAAKVQEVNERNAALTFSEWGKLYFAEKCNKQKRSIEWERCMFRNLESRLGSLALADIDEPVIDAYKNARLEDAIVRHGKPIENSRVSFSSVNRELAVLRILLRLAKRHKKIGSVPEFNLESEKSRRRQRVATDDEYQALLANMPRHAARALIGLYETSARVNELLRLTWDRVDEKAGVIRFKAEHVKEKMARVTPISPEFRAVLNELRAEQKALTSIGGHVFTNKGKPIKSVRKQFEAARRAAGISDLRLHDLRHTAITRWELAGVPAGAIMAASGHHTVEMHNRYVNVNEQQVRSAFLATTWQHEKRVDGAASVSY